MHKECKSEQSIRYRHNNRNNKYGNNNIKSIDIISIKQEEKYE